MDGAGDPRELTADGACCIAATFAHHSDPARLNCCPVYILLPCQQVTSTRGSFIMRFGKFVMAAAAATMAVAPAVAAPANPAASLSVSKSVRAGSASAKKNELAGGGIVIALIAAAAVVAGIVVVADSDDSSESQGQSRHCHRCIERDRAGDISLTRNTRLFHLRNLLVPPIRPQLRHSLIHSP